MESRGNSRVGAFYALNTPHENTNHVFGVESLYVVIAGMFVVHGMPLQGWRAPLGLA